MSIRSIHRWFVCLVFNYPAHDARDTSKNRKRAKGVQTNILAISVTNSGSRVTPFFP